MQVEELLKQIPTQRLKAVDGLAITAAIWEEAHGFHRQQLQAHYTLGHGSGILIGLEVLASDPPDHTVYVLPGVAVDPLGRLIFITEPTLYDFGEAIDGHLYLLLSYGETPILGTATAEESIVHEISPTYIRFDYLIHAPPSPPSAPWVELARVTRSRRQASIHNARDPEQPGPDELDLRFRRYVGAAQPETVRVAVCYLGSNPPRHHGQGMLALARELRRTGTMHVWVDDAVPLTASLSPYTLVYLVGREAFSLEREEMDALYAYLRSGGTVFAESCHQDVKGTPPAEGAFTSLWRTLGIKLEPLVETHDLLRDPHLFASPPRGFVPASQEASLHLGGGVILGGLDYGCLWRGMQQDGLPSRAAIRAAQEWGHNLLTYACRRRHPGRAALPR